MIVGYVSAKGGKVKAVVLTQGALRAVGLDKIELVNIPAELRVVLKPAKVGT